MYKKFEGLLQELKESFEHSVTEEIKDTEGGSKRHLVFLLGREVFALPVEQLREVVIDKPIIPVPGAPPSIHGVINYRNRILSVSSIHHILQIPFKKPDSSYILVLGCIKFETALLVDDLVNLITINQRDVRPKISGQRESVNRLITGGVYYRKSLVTLLDLRGI